MSQRMIWQDVAKGIGIILVVFGHMERGLVSAHILTLAIWEQIDFALYTFHMPLFMFLSGLNVFHSKKKGRSRFIKSKFYSVLYPFLVWSIIEGGVLAVAGKYTNAPQEPGALTHILTQPISPFWFLYALFFFMMMSSILSASSLLLVGLVVFPFGELFSRNDFIHQLIHFLLFFSFGVMAGEKEKLLSIISNKYICISCLAAYVVCVAWGLVSYFQNYNSVFMLPAAIGGIGVILWLSYKLSGVQTLATLGRFTMPIYVMHILVGASLRIAFIRFSPLIVPSSVVLTVCTLAALFVPIFIYKILAGLKLQGVLGLDGGKLLHQLSSEWVRWRSCQVQNSSNGEGRSG